MVEPGVGAGVIQDDDVRQLRFRSREDLCRASDHGRELALVCSLHDLQTARAYEIFEDLAEEGRSEHPFGVHRPQIGDVHRAPEEPVDILPDEEQIRLAVLLLRADDGRAPRALGQEVLGCHPELVAGRREQKGFELVVRSGRIVRAHDGQGCWSVA